MRIHWGQLPPPPHAQVWVQHLLVVVGLCSSSTLGATSHDNDDIGVQSYLGKWGGKRGVKGDESDDPTGGLKQTPP